MRLTDSGSPTVFKSTSLRKIHFVQQAEGIKMKTYNQSVCFKILSWFYFEFVIWVSSVILIKINRTILSTILDSSEETRVSTMIDCSVYYVTLRNCSNTGQKLRQKARQFQVEPIFASPFSRISKKSDHHRLNTSRQEDRPGHFVKSSSFAICRSNSNLLLTWLPPVAPSCFHAQS